MWINNGAVWALDYIIKLISVKIHIMDRTGFLRPFRLIMELYGHYIIKLIGVKIHIMDMTCFLRPSRLHSSVPSL